LLEVLTGGDGLLFIEKTHSYWELMFVTDRNSSESSPDSNNRVNDSDSDLTDTSELAQPITYLIQF
jgi:hypothetical protein